MEYLTSKDIEKEIIIKEKIDKLKHEMNIEKNVFSVKNSLLDKGIDPISKETISKKEAEMKKSILREKYTKYLEEKNNDLVSLTHGLYYKREIVEEKEETKEEKHNSAIPIIIILSTLALSLLGGLGYKSYKNNKENKIITEKTSEISKELEDVINDSTFIKVGNTVINNGTSYYVSDDQASIDYSEYLDYSKIADYIENSDNPELALFTLYKDYGTKKGIPLYNGITNRTIQDLSFDLKGNIIKCNLEEYNKLNGYNSSDDYFENCKKELVQDNDAILDNIKIKVKKMANK